MNAQRVSPTLDRERGLGMEVHVLSDTGQASDPLIAARVEELERELVTLRAARYPLRKVYDFRLTLFQSFWDDVIKITPEEWIHARSQTWPDRVVLERWVTHDSLKIWEGLRDERYPVLERPMDVYVNPRFAGRHPTSLRPLAARLIDVYQGLPLLNGVLAWDLWLAPPDPATSVWEQSAPRIQLRVNGFNFQLAAVYGRFGEPMELPDDRYPHPEQVLCEVPLNQRELQGFERGPDPESDDPDRYEPEPALMCYEAEIVARGIAWQLWLHDFREAS